MTRSGRSPEPADVPRPWEAWPADDASAEPGGPGWNGQPPENPGFPGYRRDIDDVDLGEEHPRLNGAAPQPSTKPRNGHRHPRPTDQPADSWPVADPGGYADRRDGWPPAGTGRPPGGPTHAPPDPHQEWYPDPDYSVDYDDVIGHSPASLPRPPLRRRGDDDDRPGRGYPAGPPAATPYGSPAGPAAYGTPTRPPAPDRPTGYPGGPGRPPAAYPRPDEGRGGDPARRYAGYPVDDDRGGGGGAPSGYTGYPPPAADDDRRAPGPPTGPVRGYPVADDDRRAGPGAPSGPVRGYSAYPVADDGPAAGGRVAPEPVRGPPGYPPSTDYPRPTDPPRPTDYPRPTGWPAAGYQPGYQPGDGDEATEQLTRYVPATEVLDREAQVYPDARPITPKHPPRAVVRRRRARRRAMEWPFLVAFALVAAFLIRTFAIQTYFIPSGSMHETLLEGDRVMVNKLSYKVHDVHRGDVVVFQTPPNFPVDEEDLIKRVIGLPGETVQAQGRKILINGRPLQEPYVEPKCGGTDDFAPVTVPAGHLWVMGDNRCESGDSRRFGAIEESLVVGRAFILVWPFGRLAWL